MTGDEVRARQLLFEMQDRVIRDPHGAFGLTGTPTPQQIRSAFLETTKTFHPAKFARMAPDLQRLANEVFLLLRAAHDTLLRPTVPPKRTTTGANPITPVRSSSTSLPTVGRTAAPGRSTTPPFVPRTPTPVRSLTPPSVPRTPTPVPPQASPPRTPGITFRSATEATQPMRPVHERTPTASTRPSGPTPSSIQRPQRMPAASPAPRIPRDPRRPTPAAGIPQQTPRPQPTGRPAGGSPPADELGPIVALLEQNHFAAARAALEVLAKGAPTNVRYRALIGYANGREAQLAGQVGDARVELMGALQLDPDLQLAKSALAELFNRRK